MLSPGTQRLRNAVETLAREPAAAAAYAGTSRAGCSLVGYLEWLLELDALIRRRPVDQGKRLTAGELPR